MKKRTICLTATLLFVLTLLFSNLALGAPKQLYKDGTYKAEESVYDKYGGYKATVTITIKAGKITKATYDAFTKDGKAKSKDAAYEANMSKTNKIGPKEYMAQLPAQLVKVQNADKVDVVTGATHSTENFKQLTKLALDNAKKGIKTTAILKVQ